jgi:hypothetical protein
MPGGSGRTNALPLYGVPISIDFDIGKEAVKYESRDDF